MERGKEPAGSFRSVSARHLYVHVPFCARRCVYCDFSIAVRTTVPEQEYLGAIGREWTLRHPDRVPDLDTLYFGGGTPSRLGVDGVTRLMALIGERAPLRAGAEVTLEANPEDVDVGTARAWLRAGITRLSIGVQSFSDDVLRWMHRTHDAEKARRAIETARDAGFRSLSIDLIFAVPGALRRSWRDDIETVATLGLSHVSVYGLTVEPHTPLGRWVARADVAERPEDEFEQEFLHAHEVLTSAGLEHYEVSNYGAPGMHSRHNWSYWSRRPYIGLGPSAHEFDGQTRRWNVEPYVEWVKRLANGEDPVGGSESLTPEQEVAERLYLGLRTHSGLVLSGAELERARAWEEAGWAAIDPTGTTRLTPLGWLRLDALANDLTLLRSRY